MAHMMPWFAAIVPADEVDALLAHAGFRATCAKRRVIVKKNITDEKSMVEVHICGGDHDAGIAIGYFHALLDQKIGL